MSNAKQTAATVIEIAASHLNNGASMASSAALCHADAVRILAGGNAKTAAEWAVRSLSYSVGGFHADHAKAKMLASCVA